MNETELTSLLASMDADGNGTIDVGEFVEFVEGEEEPTEEEIARAASFAAAEARGAFSPNRRSTLRPQDFDKMLRGAGGGSSAPPRSPARVEPTAAKKAAILKRLALQKAKHKSFAEKAAKAGAAAAARARKPSTVSSSDMCKKPTSAFHAQPDPAESQAAESHPAALVGPDDLAVGCRVCVRLPYLGQAVTCDGIIRFIGETEWSDEYIRYVASDKVRGLHTLVCGNLRRLAWPRLRLFGNLHKRRRLVQTAARLHSHTHTHTRARARAQLRCGSRPPGGHVQRAAERPRAAVLRVQGERHSNYTLTTL
jgi:hypothetical protein